MKHRSILVSLLVICISLVMLSGCASTPRVLSDEEMWSKFVGEWINLERVGGAIPCLDRVYFYENQKSVFTANFVGEEWDKVDDSQPVTKSLVTPRKFWIDEDGNTYCQLLWKYTSPPGYASGLVASSAALFVVSKSGTTLEYNRVFGLNLDDERAVAFAFDKILTQINTEIESLMQCSGRYYIYYRE